jgi:hypothetical protein
VGRSPSHGEVGPRGIVAIGVLATLTMDAAFVGMSRLGGSSFASDKVGPDVVGRWAAGLGRGRFRHDDIAQEPRVHGEVALGLATHYLTGVALSGAYSALLRGCSVRPNVLTALGFGAASTLLPLLVLHPSYGYGCCARRTADAARITRIIFIGHATFGVGIGVWSAALRKAGGSTA